MPLTLRAANDFVEAHHRHSARTSNDGGKFAIGMEWGGALVGVAIVGRPVARLLHQPGTAEILRLCASPAAPRNTCSKLYGRAKRIWQLMGGDRVVTYTLEAESGASLRAAGFVIEQRVRGRTWDTPTRRRAPRASEQLDKTRWGSVLPEVPA
ncbi:MAG TPA: XF1762 family protein [Allosphingosinicella sp.]|nr:XF1762 family protein [Allosphingosinicella sp.]